MSSQSIVIILTKKTLLGFEPYIDGKFSSTRHYVNINLHKINEKNDSSGRIC